MEGKEDKKEEELEKKEEEIENNCDEKIDKKVGDIEMSDTDISENDDDDDNNESESDDSDSESESDTNSFDEKEILKSLIYLSQLKKKKKEKEKNEFLPPLKKFFQIKYEKRHELYNKSIKKKLCFLAKSILTKKYPENIRMNINMCLKG